MERIPPTVVLEWRERVRLYKSLADQRRVWIQRIHADLFQHGVAVPEGEIRTPSTRQWLASDEVTLTPAARERIAVGYAMIDATDAAALPLREQLQRFGMRQPGCRSLVDAHYGVGGLTAVAVWSELGDCRRFSRSQQVVRHTGLDVTVDSSDLLAPAATCHARDRRCCAGRCSKPGCAPPGPAAPTTPTTGR